MTLLIRTLHYLESGREFGNPSCAAAGSFGGASFANVTLNSGTNASRISARCREPNTALFRTKMWGGSAETGRIEKANTSRDFAAGVRDGISLEWLPSQKTLGPAEEVLPVTQRIT
jgi:hypothetical protein